MYDENTNKELSGKRTEDEYRSEEQAPNFILKTQEEGQYKDQSQPYPNGASQGDSQSQPCLNGSTQGASQSQTYWNGSTQGTSQSQPYSNGAAQGASQNQSYLNGSTQGTGQSQSYPNMASQPGQNQQYQNAAGQPGQPQTYQNPAGQGGYGQQQGTPVRNYNWQEGELGIPSDAKKEQGRNSSHTEKKKRSGGMGRKVAGITAAALLFGTVSGGTMVGVNMLAGSFHKQEAYTPVTQPEASTEEAATQAVIVPSAGSKADTAVVLDVSDIVEAAMPSVVSINNTMLYEGSTWFGQRQQYEVPSSGSGIIVGKNDDELLVVTNNHVVEGSNKLSVVFIDDESIDAIIKGTDAESDLAVVAVPLKDIPESTLNQISIAKLGNSEELKVGQGVIAIGNALGYGQSTTVGYISALDREVTTDNSTTRHLLQTDAAINPGNSGGALLNMKGEVIGINAAKYSRTDVEGIGYAIPVSQVQDIIDSLMIRRSTIVEEGEEGYLGIQGLTVDESMVKQLDMPAGVFVYAIIDDGAAADSDLREKDVITKFDGQNIRSMAALQDLLKRYKSGETIELTVQSLENGKYVERTVFVTLGKKTTLGEES